MEILDKPNPISVVSIKYVSGVVRTMIKTRDLHERAIAITRIRNSGMIKDGVIQIDGKIWWPQFDRSEVRRKIS